MFLEIYMYSLQLYNFECPLTLRDHTSLHNVHILGIGVTFLNHAAYNMNKSGHMFNTILSSSPSTSIFLAVQSIFCIKKKQSKFRHNSSLWCAFFLSHHFKFYGRKMVFLIFVVTLT